MIKKVADLNDLFNKEIFEIINHKVIIDKIKEKSLLKIFAKQYYCLSRAFPEILLMACLSLESEESKLSIIENLYDEFGKGVIESTHRSLYMKFLDALEIPICSITPFPTTAAYINGMKGLCQHGKPIEILSALGPGCESFTASQYQNIINTIRLSHDLSRTDLEFFYDHVQHDEFHNRILERVIDEKLLNPYDIELSAHGFQQALIYEKMFWDGLLSKMDLE